MKSSSTLSTPSTVFYPIVKFEKYTDTHTPEQVKEEFENRTFYQQDILNTVDDVASKYYISPDLITESYKRFNNPLNGELGGNLEVEYILTNAIDPFILLLIFENFSSLLEVYPDEETKEIVRDYFFQLLDTTTSFLEDYDKIYPKETPRLSLNISTNISAALLLQTSSTLYDFYTFNHKVKNSPNSRAKSTNKSMHPHFYLSEILSPDFTTVSLTDQLAREHVRNTFFSLSSFPKEGITPQLNLKPYIPTTICRFNKRTKKLNLTTPVGYPLEVLSYSTIQDRLTRSRLDANPNIRNSDFRSDQLNDIITNIVDEKSEVNAFIKQQTNFQLTPADLNLDRLKQ
jgi:hypothetical protein